ncbi:hypothetical protein DIQ79_14410 [Mycolicibacterium smegmatis]|uniref:Uncharacterized protein n=1 Tax=Mycolicibacterium smegmatis (strain ATCC 700084 / mc(2)155) TaxID=246196 RepID=A0QP56_MYCS2|nr:hypothetical protein MSMEG_0278 [Mycolicibacterium smegmatis MC2 155]TBM48553.1 hypothetical protein DIQ86_08245 [Mycolicibacterium smegmatis]TBH39650.1 hypothetical protein EYS45_17775 [Mycolicibacterium smegmatis MC2 155]TBM50675.1 hypothetical protein DIQ85_14785 [Mycolicibacterium smegmatis]TBM61874.1 hypothetical protein DIQ83_14465 [Mycolicibacterium smegmatis]
MRPCAGEQIPVGIGQRRGAQTAAHDRIGEPLTKLPDRHAERDPDVVLAWTPEGSPREDEPHDVTVVGIHRPSLSV